MNRFLKVTLLILSPVFLFAQEVEVGIMLGATGYSGELTPSSNRFSTGKAHPSFGVFGRIGINRFLTGRLSFTSGKISGDDADANSEFAKARNLRFQSNINELAGIVEFNPLGNNSTGSLLQPYVYGGIALFRFNPKTNYGGQLVELQPLGTEGQGIGGFADNYKLTQVSLPMGIGVKYRLTDQINLGVDIGLRKTFTDYLDDVSGAYVNYNELMAGNGQLAAALGNRQGELTGEPVIVETGTRRGNSDTKDWYYNAGLTLSYTFHNNSRRRSKKEIGCPSFVH